MIPLRVLRLQASGFPPSTPAEAEEPSERLRLMTAAAPLLLLNGPSQLSFGTLAEALGSSRPTLRTLFSDMEGLLGAILARHLNAVRNAVRRAASGGVAAARAAYRQVVFDTLDCPVTDHALLTRYRHCLPPDQSAIISALVDEICACLSDAHGPAVLALLDTAGLKLDMVERMLGVLDGHVPTKASFGRQQAAGMGAKHIESRDVDDRTPVLLAARRHDSSARKHAAEAPCMFGLAGPLNQALRQHR